jgi:hypothetical protein
MTDHHGNREGFGDDQGTRIGSPDPGRPRSEEPRGEEPGGAAQPPETEGLLAGSASGRDTDATEAQARRERGTTREDTGAGSEAPSGMGAEAAEGIHGAQGRAQNARTGVSAPRDSDGEGPERVGSEPLRATQPTHQGGYGGEMGQPKESSDKREGPSR